ncbi:hypothetical protein OsI_16258 [Oryza sativa Indica Group]|uniref:Uncharacterized protein n=1 Tax=Oryza sativa subsp. indica TaxID=39946 RepID=B8AV54_ORYSI|nr:hypothetical protein OsI_16258 [Oryza sativa Indica Group]
MALAAQLYGSAAAAAYRRLPLYGVPSSCRWPRTPLAALPKLSISTGGMGMNPFGVGAKVSIKCTNGTTQVDELNFRSNQTEETNRILPWAFYASLSTAMACFYAYVLLSGGNPPPKKKMAATPSS